MTHLRHQLVIAAHAGLALLLLPLGLGAHKLQLLVKQALQAGLLLALALQPLVAGLQPLREVALEGDALPAVQLQDPARYIVQEVSAEAASVLLTPVQSIPQSQQSKGSRS